MFLLLCEPSVVNGGQALKSLHAEETLPDRLLLHKGLTRVGGGGEPVAPLKVTTGTHVNRLSHLFYNPDS